MTDPHARQPVYHAGVPLGEARLAVILVHGRGGSPEDMLSLASALRVDDVAYLAPQADSHSWYPYSFLTPIDRNEPGLSSGLAKIGALVDHAAESGLGAERVALIGFSQGACLSLEYAARHATRYAAVIALSGGLIGPPGTPRDYPGTFDGTPAFLGCSDVDPHIPLERVHESADVFARMGAEVDKRIYPGMGHTVSPDEIKAVQKLLTL